MSVSVLGIPVDILKTQELEALLESWFCDGKSHTIVTPNPEMILAAQNNSAFREGLIQADLHLPDAVGICYALLAFNLHANPTRHTGVDTLKLLVKLAEKNQKKILIFGGEGDGAERAAKHFQSIHSNLVIHGYNPGILALHDGHLELTDVDRAFIKASSPDVIALALPHEKQVAFFEHLSNFPSVRIAIGIGGAADMFSGALPRAPEWMQQLGLEWMWRLLLEPKRWKRIFRATIVFPIVIAGETMRTGTFLAAVQRIIPSLFRKFGD
ncbi:MAG: WecB/TagA/CpsF family glycosyltransferase [Patescibacteria group bacterium]|jgi:N-acetylglucosaminyldiphosphoundecaprenol N-acetyl-beta-D-mannosaminyltransferase